LGTLGMNGLKIIFAYRSRFSDAGSLAGEFPKSSYAFWAR